MISVQGTTWICSAGPVHCTMVTAIDWVETRADGVEHARIAERRGVALLLQLEAGVVDTAGGIDRQHELQVGLGLRCRRLGCNCYDRRQGRDQ